MSASSGAGCGRPNAKLVTLDDDILHTAARKRGARDPAGERVEVGTELGAPLARVCQVLDAPHSTALGSRATIRPVAIYLSDPSLGRHAFHKGRSVARLSLELGVSGG